MKRRLDATKLQFALKLSSIEAAVYNFRESSTMWIFRVYRQIENNEEWLYFNYQNLSANLMMLTDFFVKLLPNPVSNLNVKATEKICEANAFGPTKFLSWAFVMDPKNGYIRNGKIKIEIEYNYTYRAARKSSGGKAPCHQLQSVPKAAKMSE